MPLRPARCAAQELRDGLWEVCDKRLAENEAGKRAVEEDPFIAAARKAAEGSFAALAQLELDRFVATVRIPRHPE